MRTLCLAAALAVAGTPTTASAQSFPSRPVTMIAPVAVGGPTDTIGRIIAEGMRAALGQAVIVENVTGANGTIGVGRLARAAPDGYTFGIGHWSTHVVNGAVYALPYDVLKDFEPVALLATNPQVIVSRNAIPATNLRELIAWLRANPEKATQATVGPGSQPHVAGVYLQKLSDTRFQFVPYRGAAPAMQDLLGGQIDLMIPQAAIALPQVRTGKIRAYAVTAKTRLDSAPEIPTVDEAGLPGLHVATWHALWVPKGTPKNAIARLNAAAVASLNDPAVRQRLADLGQEIPARERLTPEALAVHHRAEIEKWWPIIKEANIRAE